jgi:acetolactate synthase-1/2/3 large subunit
MNGPAFRSVDLVVDALIAHGIDQAFGVPREVSFHSTLGRDEIEFVTCRHESSAILVAAADATLKGEVSVAMVRRDPGAFNAGLGLHVATQQAVRLVGQMKPPDPNLDAIQEVDETEALRTGHARLIGSRSGRKCLTTSNDLSIA